MDAPRKTIRLQRATIRELRIIFGNMETLSILTREKLALSVAMDSNKPEAISLASKALIAQLGSNTDIYRHIELGLDFIIRNRAEVERAIRLIITFQRGNAPAHLRQGLKVLQSFDKLRGLVEKKLFNHRGLTQINICLLHALIKQDYLRAKSLMQEEARMLARVDIEILRVIPEVAALSHGPIYSRMLPYLTSRNTPAMQRLAASILAMLAFCGSAQPGQSTRPPVQSEIVAMAMKSANEKRTPSGGMTFNLGGKVFGLGWAPTFSAQSETTARLSAEASAKSAMSAALKRAGVPSRSIHSFKIGATLFVILADVS